MFFLSKPDRDILRSFVSAQENQPFSYAEVGASRKKAPTGYTSDHNRIYLGTGRDTFECAKAAVKQWKMFDIPWIHLCWPDTPIEPGATVAVLVSHLGFWSLNACRIVYVIEEHGPVERYGFAYGTLPGHAAFGEERFTVEYDIENGAVGYDLFAFSRPGPLPLLAYPFTRALQKRFARDSKAAMQKYLAGRTGADKNGAVRHPTPI
jgi:uncharacterized protein (UPF0548 family)